MSTYLYLRCEDHNPPLRADQESTQHAGRPSDMDDLRRWVDDRGLYLKMADEDELDWTNRYLANTVRFLSQHRLCRVGAVDQYGYDWDLATGDLVESDGEA